MSIKKLIKKMIPKSVKNAIKKDIGISANLSLPVEYVIRTSDTKRFEGKRIVVTGATGAIGSAICQRLLAEGATVGVCGRNKQKLDDLVEKFKKENFSEEKIVPLIIDVTNDESIYSAIDLFAEKTGGLDALVNNAGGGARAESKPIHEQDVAVIDSVLNSNLRGSIVCAKKAAQVMVTQKCGKIINMSSVIGMQGKATMSDYAAAKAGIIGFTKSLALELGEYNITVNCISPGMVNQTPFDAGMPIKQTDKNCLKRMGYTDEVANLVVFVLSDESNFITGNNFVIDGGRSLGLYGDT